MKVFWEKYWATPYGEAYMFDITMRYFTFKRIENALKEHHCFIWGKAHNPIEFRKGQYDPETKTIVLHFWVSQRFYSWSREYGRYIASSHTDICEKAISLIGLAAQYERITEETYRRHYAIWDEDSGRILDLSAFH